jgi:hypothetical protein
MRLPRRHTRHLATVAVVASLVTACGGSDDAAEPSATEPAATEPATGEAVDTLPPLETAAAPAETYMTLPPGPVAPSIVATPAELCALLTADEVAQAMTVDGFDPGAFTFAAPQVSGSGSACTINVAAAGVVNLFPSEYFGDQATFLLSYPTGQVVSEGVVFVPDSATTQGWILLPTGAAVEVESSLPFEFTPTILAALAATLQS